MNFTKNFLLLLAILAFSYLTSPIFGSLYKFLFPKIDIAAGYIGFFGLPIAYAFFLFLIFTIFGGKGKYWWIGILTLPALAFELYFDLSHIYFPVFLALLGWLIGLGIQKIVLKPKRN